MVDFFSFIFGSAFTLIGLKTFKVARRVYPYLIGRSHLTLTNPNSLKIAIISGSTDGLGKSFAKKLYQHDYKLVLLGRSESKMINVLDQLQSTNHETIEKNISKEIIDFGNANLTEISSYAERIQKLLETKIDSHQVNKYSSIQLMLINSCGDAHISRYEHTSVEQISRIHAVNLNSFHFMSQVFFKLRLRSPLQPINIPKKYFFINVSSGVDERPNNYSSIYSGCKAYCSNVMQVLDQQNKANKSSNPNEPVKFLNLTPLYIKTKMIRHLSEWDVAQPDTIVDGAFKLLNRKSEGSGCLIHQVLKQFPFLVNGMFAQRVQKALLFKNKLLEMQSKRKNKSNKTL